VRNWTRYDECRTCGQPAGHQCRDKRYVEFHALLEPHRGRRRVRTYPLTLLWEGDYS
jgi:hypothetical protein